MFKLLFLLCEHHNDPLALLPYHDTRRHRLFGMEEHDKSGRWFALDNVQALLPLPEIKQTFLTFVAKTAVVTQYIPELIRNSFL